MSINPKAYGYAADILNERRLAAFEKTEASRAGIYEKLPELAELDRKTAFAALGAAKAAASSTQNSSETLQSEIEALEAEKKELLQKNGFAADALAAFHYCYNCNDTGYDVAGNACGCLTSLVRDFTLREINETTSLSLSSFEDFSLDYYSDEKIPELGASAKQIMSRTLEVCREYARQFKKTRPNLLMMGSAGLGKTHLALSIANELIGSGVGVVYCGASGILKKIEAEYFGRADGDTLCGLLDCDLLVLDDLGTEFVSPFVVSSLYDLINTRISTNSPMIITTNISEERLLTVRYGEKISSRLAGCFTPLYFAGEDIRLQKNDMA